MEQTRMTRTTVTEGSTWLLAGRLVRVQAIDPIERRAIVGDATGHLDKVPYSRLVPVSPFVARALAGKLPPKVIA